MISVKSEIVKKVFAYYFLNPKAKHYVRELATLLKVDPGNLSKKMSELKKEGLFLVESEGKNRYFSLNQDYYLLNEYRKIYDAKFGVAESLSSVLKKINGLTEAYLFGSYAKGNFEEGSDLDLLIIGDHQHQELIGALLVLEKKWHREISVIDFSQKEFAQKMKKKDDFLENIFSGKMIKLI
jgi:predicted nucleotidyltransferase